MEISYDFIGLIVILIMLVRFNYEKFLRLTTGFGCIMYFPFFSAGHVPMGSGRDKIAGVRSSNTRSGTC